MRGEAIPIETVLQALKVQPPNMQGVRSEAEFVARWKEWLAEDVKRAYRTRMLELHPDRHVGKTPEEQQALLEQTQQINSFYDLLCKFDPRNALPRRQQMQMVRVVYVHTSGCGTATTNSSTYGGGARFNVRWSAC